MSVHVCYTLCVDGRRQCIRTHPDGTKHYYVGTATTGMRLIKKMIPVECHIEWWHYTGECGLERLVRVDGFSNTDPPSSPTYSTHYEGEKGCEHIVREESHHDGLVYFLTGGKGKESYVRCVQDGDTCLFEDGRMTRKVFKNGEVAFVGDGERVIRREFPNGVTEFYEGPRNAERLVHGRFPNGVKMFFEGPRDSERHVRTEFPDGVTEFYVGVRNAERLVRLEYSPLPCMMPLRRPKGKATMLRAAIAKKHTRVCKRLRRMR